MAHKAERPITHATRERIQGACLRALHHQDPPGGVMTHHTGLFRANDCAELRLTDPADSRRYYAVSTDSRCEDTIPLYVGDARLAVRAVEYDETCELMLAKTLFALALLPTTPVAARVNAVHAIVSWLNEVERSDTWRYADSAVEQMEGGR